MHTSVRAHIRSCPQCQKFKHGDTPRHRLPLGDAANVGVSVAGHTVQADFLGPFDPSEVGGYKYLLVLIDVFSHYCVFIPTVDQTAQTVLAALAAGWIGYFGFPRRIIHDGGPGFSAEIFKALAERAGIADHTTTPHSPESNGVVERMNRVLLDMIRTTLEGRTSYWTMLIPFLMLAANTYVSRAIGVAPSAVHLGFTAYTALDALMENVASSGDGDHVSAAQRARNIAREKEDVARAALLANKAYQDAMRRHNETATPLADLTWAAKGNLVLVRLKSKDIRASKHAARVKGPFVVVEHAGTHTLVLHDRVIGDRGYFRVHARDAMPYDASRVTNWDLVQGSISSDFCLVQEVTKHNRKGRSLELWVKWKGRDRLFNSWEVASKIQHTQAAQRYLFDNNLPGAPRQRPPDDGKEPLLTDYAEPTDVPQAARPRNSKRPRAGAGEPHDDSDDDDGGTRGVKLLTRGDALKDLHKDD